MSTAKGSESTRLKMRAKSAENMVSQASFRAGRESSRRKSAEPIDIMPSLQRQQSKGALKPSASVKRYDERRKGADALGSQDAPAAPVDEEIYVSRAFAKLTEGVEPNSTQVRLIKKGEKLIVKKRADAPTMPPTKRLQIAVPNTRKRARGIRMRCPNRTTCCLFSSSERCSVQLAAA